MPMSTNVDGTIQGETQVWVQELPCVKHWFWAAVGRCSEIDVDGTIQGETREQEKKDWDWARAENRCKKDKVPVYEASASVQYNKFYFI